MELDKIKRILVVGAGTMGHAIAQVYATAGFEVDLVDLNQEVLANAMNKIKSNLSLLVEYKHVKSGEISNILNRIHPSTDLKVAAQNCDLVLEAVSEDRNVKREVFSQLNEFCSEDIILASNTSELNIFNVAKVKNPKRLVIHHWFHPPYIIPLVEIVAGRKTSSEVIDISFKLLEKIGKKPLILKKFTNAFVVNKIQQAINSAVFSLLIKGIASPEEIDMAIKNSVGIRLPFAGVVQNLDFVGLDVVYDIIKNMGGMDLVLLKDKVENGQLGAKTSIGFYDYQGRTEEEILTKRDKLYLQMLDYLKKMNAFEPI
ncbi:3-hydroxybutyryl-CoA dehydrogenase [subsurface metagenome]